MYCLLRPCYRLSYKLVSKFKYIILSISFIMILNYFGAFTHMFEVMYDEHFSYPYNGDVHEFVNALRYNQKPAVDPINVYNYSFIHNNEEKCIESERSKFRIVYIIKSAIKNFDRRIAIRHSWGFEKRFFDVPSRTVFLLGIPHQDEELQAKIKLEATKYKDIVQANFIDTYYNNTIKTMMGFKWAVKYCSNSKFYMFVDDDMYVSVKNVLRFIRNPTNYPDYLKEPKKISQKREIRYPYESKRNFSHVSNLLNNENENNYLITKYISDTSTNVKEKLLSNAKLVKLSEVASATQENVSNPDYSLGNQLTTVLNNNSENTQNIFTKINNSINEERIFKDISTLYIYNETESLVRKKRQVFDFELPEDVRLFAGFVFVSSPHRHRSSKWYVSLEEYPYHLWPPYITAGAYILSREALLDMYYTSFYTKHFKFDDIFMGLVAKKADIEPFHCEEFHFYKKDYTKFNYKYVITSHGYGNPNELLQVWNEQKALGNA
ncbi:PREDICTED: beta-1,3-galactosyltransferase brn [Polistes canadensis]|uniref:beta-1,3-galactosyltransferase brn n=1 Tax=Polistes canadensis TaxID=91411 RepID=UPI000718B409|nr:PREDICTED: beta-1,3-galactosyltransferase brn [Polistes canadensis]